MNAATHIRGFGVAGVLWLVLVAGCEVDPLLLPRIDLVTPSAAPTGQVVSFLGEGFCEPEDVAGGGACRSGLDAFVAFGGTASVPRAQASWWYPDRVDVEVPPEARAGLLQVVITVWGRPSSPVAFEVMP